MTGLPICALTLFVFSGEPADRFVIRPTDPVISGHNIFAPDVVQVKQRWRCYYGGWQEPTQTNDQIYVVETDIAPGQGSWSTPQLQIGHGTYDLLNDPSVACGENGTWYMLYTVAFVHHNPLSFDEWIAYSTSPDGLVWSPAAGTPQTKIRLVDPNRLAGGVITGIARPSLVRDGDTWRLWCDADVDRQRRPQSYLAVAHGPIPADFTVVHRYPPLPNGFASFWEPDVVRTSTGSYLAVRQANFTELLVGESPDGIHFDFRTVLRTTDAGYARERVSNPALVYDDGHQQLAGLAFGMSSASLIDHDIGFARRVTNAVQDDPGR